MRDRVASAQSAWASENSVVACAFRLMIKRPCDAAADANVKSYRPGKITLILAAVACALTFIGIAINFFGNGRVEFSHCVLALGLLAFVVWFSGRRNDDE